MTLIAARRKWRSLKKGSLCLLAGKLNETSEEIKAHLQVAEDEIMQLIRKLDSGALRAVLTRDEPETFKIGEDDLPQEVLANLTS